MKAEEEYNSLFEKEGSIEAPPSTKGVGRIWLACEGTPLTYEQT